MKKTVAVANQKGGVGKTTISINFACGLAMNKNKVLLIDLDSQANSTLSLGVELDNLGIQDVLMNDQDTSNK